MSKDITGKYHIDHVDGTPISGGATFVVLRLDGDNKPARLGALNYAKGLTAKDPHLASIVLEATVPLIVADAATENNPAAPLMGLAGTMAIRELQELKAKKDAENLQNRHQPDSSDRKAQLG